MALVAMWVGAGFALAAIGHVALFSLAYRPVLRARRQGRWDATPNPPQMHDFAENAIGVAPGSAYLYASYVLNDDEVLVLEGCVHPEATYAGLTLYDDYLQGVRGRLGPTHLSDTALGRRWRVIVARENPGVEPFLDSSGQAAGIIAFRHAPRSTMVPPTLRVMRLHDVEAKT
ncbi:MAG: hypothetical protein KTR31_31740 [Myxococcales bacterium]|nr:hypothetical protein [Myxococcales bacterium]